MVEKRSRFNGFLFALFMVLYGTFRFINEFFRYYEGFESGMKLVHLGYFDITFSQIVSFLMIVSGIIVIIIGNRRAGFEQKA